VGQLKGEALRDRILDINPDAVVDVRLDFMRPSNVDDYILKGNDVSTDESVVSRNIIPSAVGR
jgi:tRNA A37 threonylcarbamoyladenosine dehydratase